MTFAVVADDFPWPLAGGGLVRLATVIEALSELGPTDLFALYDPRRSGLKVPEHVSIERIGTAPYPDITHPLRWRARWLARRGIPFEVSQRQFDRCSRQRFESWRRPRYDFIWFNTPAVFEWIGRPNLGPTVVDLDNRQDEIARSRARLIRDELRHAPHPGRQVVAWGQALLNAQDWKTFQRSIAAAADRVVFASELDRRGARLRNAAVVPNAFPRPERPVGHVRPGVPPVVLFQGRLNYGPNVDAAWWLARVVAPRLQVRFPGCQIRLAGRPDPRVKELHDPPTVTVVGRTPHMESELARADIVVVPIRFGSGTRVKILEAFAHRVPVVSTTVGAQGLEVEGEIHLLLADDAEGFVDACAAVLSDEALRIRIADAAERLYLERYESAVVRERVHALVLDVITRARTRS